MLAKEYYNSASPAKSSLPLLSLLLSSLALYYYTLASSSLLYSPWLYWGSTIALRRD